MREAFTELKLSFMRTIIDTSRPLVIFITDGQPDDDPRKEIDSLLQMIPTPTVIGVGVGTGTSREHLMRLLPNQPVFSVDTFAQLSTLVQRLATPAPIKHEDYFSLTLRPFDNVQYAEEPLHLKYKLEPRMNAPNGKLPAGVKVQFAANKYYLGKEFVTTRVTTEDYPAEGDFKLKVGSDGISGHAQLPELLNFIIEIPTIGKFKGTASVRLAWMTKQFLDTPPFNILVAGVMEAEDFLDQRVRKPVWSEWANCRRSTWLIQVKIT